MAIYEKLFQRVGVGWGGEGGWPFSPLWAIYENCRGGGGMQSAT